MKIHPNQEVCSLAFLQTNICHHSEISTCLDNADLRADQANPKITKGLREWKEDYSIHVLQLKCYSDWVYVDPNNISI